MMRFVFILLLVSILLGACEPTLQELDTSFPSEIDSSTHYLFCLHGKIIEDQGLPAISDEYGEYEYDAILKRFADSDLRVISAIRESDADVNACGEKLIEEIKALIDAGVPANPSSFF